MKPRLSLRVLLLLTAITVCDVVSPHRAQTEVTSGGCIGSGGRGH